MNRDESVVDDFGDEWSRFDQSDVTAQELESIFDGYFAHFPWNELPPDTVGVDVGCGTGRWAAFVAPRVGKLICVDASAQAVDVARRKLSPLPNVEVLHASVDEIPLQPGSVDFVYSLGVLHHVPDTQAGVRDCVRLLKPGGILYVYLYYSFENRPIWYRTLWRASDATRMLISRAPRPVKNAVCELAALAVYWPLARVARLAERSGLDVRNLPLAPYRHRSLYSMRTDARDRLGTRLERRFSRQEVASLLTGAGLVDVLVPTTFPYWIGRGRRPAQGAVALD